MAALKISVSDNIFTVNFLCLKCKRKLVPDNKETRKAVTKAAKELEDAKKSLFKDTKPAREKLKKANEEWLRRD